MRYKELVPHYKFPGAMIGVAICLFAVCGQAEQQPATQETATTKGDQAVEEIGEPIGGFTITTRFDKTTFNGNEPIRVGIRLKNLRQVDELLSRGPSVHNFGLKVTRDDGTPAPLTEYGKQNYLYPRGGSSINVRLKPGEEFTDSLLINRIYDLSMGGRFKISVSKRVSDTADTNKAHIVISQTTSIVVNFEQ